MRQPRCKSFDFYPDDFLHDQRVQVMTSEQRGAYVCLILAAWQSESPGILPGQRQALERLAHCTPEEWIRCEPAVGACFDRSDGHWIHRRVRREHETQTRRVEWYRKRAEAGGKATQAKWQAINEQKATSPPQAMLNACTPTPSLLHSFTPESKAKKVTAAGLARAKGRFPTLDVDLIEAKVMAEHEVHPFKNLDRALLGWCKTAEKNGWDAKTRAKLAYVHPPRI